MININQNFPLRFCIDYMFKVILIKFSRLRRRKNNKIVTVRWILKVCLAYWFYGSIWNTLVDKGKGWKISKLRNLENNSFNRTIHVES